MCPTSTASSACPTPRIGSITTSMSASPNCSPTFSPPPCQPRTECRPTHDRPPLGVVRQMAEVPGMSPWQRWTLVLVCTAVFMLLLDITVVSVALPSIQRDLRASLPDLQWVSAAYALVLAVLLLPAATLGDRLGRRRLFLVGLVIFTAGALGAFGATLGGATAIGPLAGGVLTDTLGWRSIFFINLPIGVAAFAGGVARLRESRDPAGGRADWVGTALITGALTALMFALIRGNALGWASPAIVALFATAAVAFAGFVIYELRIAAAPMADLRLFARRSFAATGFVAFAISATVNGVIIYLSLYAQNTLGYSLVHAGLAAGLVNTLRQVGTATGVAVLGALYASRVTTATLPALAGPPGAVHRLAAAVASGAGTRVAAVVPPAARAAVTHAARAGTASGLNDVLLAAAAFAALGAIAGFAYGPDPASQPPSPAPGDHSAQAAQPATAQHQAQRPAGPKTTPP